jgi:hypothetical protein
MLLTLAASQYPRTDYQSPWEFFAMEFDFGIDQTNQQSSSSIPEIVARTVSL